MKKSDNTDKFLGEIFQSAGLHKPGNNFSINILEKVSTLEIKKLRQPDWEMILTIAAITVTLGTVITIFPEFFGQLFNRTGLEGLLNYVWKLFSGILNTKLTFTGTSIIIVTVFTGAGLLLIDKIFSRPRSESAFLI